MQTETLPSQTSLDVPFWRVMAFDKHGHSYLGTILHDTQEQAIAARLLAGDEFIVGTLNGDLMDIEYSHAVALPIG